MYLTSDQFDKLLTGYNTEEAAGWQLTVGDQLAVEQLKTLRSIKGGVNFLVAIVIIGLVISLLVTCGSILG